MKAAISHLETMRGDDPVDVMLTLTCASCHVQLYLPTRIVRAKTWLCPACHILTKNE